jgi:flagellar basal body L-ring protein FlgH
MTPPNPKDVSPKASSKRGWDEIDDLFADKKKKKIADTTTIKTKEEKKTKQKRTKQSSSQASSLSSSSSRQKTSSIAGKDWVNDGLGGKYNTEGFTGRVEDGVKVFKAHVLYKADSGKTKDCPFDCNCCFI